MVDVANAQERVRQIGRKVVYRDNKELGADLKGGINETIGIHEDVVVLKREKQVVSRHTKQFGIGANIGEVKTENESIQENKKDE